MGRKKGERVGWRERRGRRKVIGTGREKGSRREIEDGKGMNKGERTGRGEWRGEERMWQKGRERTGDRRGIKGDRRKERKREKGFGRKGGIERENKAIDTPLQ